QIKRLGRIEIFSDDCGVIEAGCKISANRISVQSGNKPVFLREAFVNAGQEKGLAAWNNTIGLTPVELDQDEVTYEVLK
ncbi:MAG: hypothetical protein JO022_06600, partial [Acidobacteriaceae bacterium]|nr:hypothetical protein [Acidobacteriaceae bacterium]